MKTVLVTGGYGFIGSYFVRLLLRQTSWHVVNLDKLTYAGDPSRLSDEEGNARCRYIRGDIMDRELLSELFAKETPCAVVNFAAESHVDRSILDSAPFLHTNVGGVQALLEAARRHEVQRFLQISTDEVYGDASGREAFSEDSPLRPSSPYAASKAAADLLCLSYQRTYGVPTLIVRSSNNYGPFQFPEKLIPLVIRNALAGETLPIYGTGHQRRDWLYVEDNCEAILSVLERGTVGRAYNVAAGEERANLEVVRKVCDLVAKELGVDPQSLVSRIRSVQDRPGHDIRYALRTDRIRTELGWAPRVPFEQGLQYTVRWYVRRRDWLDRVASPEYDAYCEAVYRRGWNSAGQ